MHQVAFLMDVESVTDTYYTLWQRQNFHTLGTRFDMRCNWKIKRNQISYLIVLQINYYLFF